MLFTLWLDDSFSHAKWDTREYTCKHVSHYKRISRDEMKDIKYSLDGFKIIS